MCWPRVRSGKLGIALGLSALLLAVSGTNEAQAYIFGNQTDDQTCAAEKVHIPASPNLMVYADSSASMREPINSGSGPLVTQTINVLTEGTIDEGLKVEPANAPGNAGNRPGLSLSQRVVIPPYAWIANNTNHTVSKFNMKTYQEEGRYRVGQNPSRTAVDLDGNAWVTTRDDGWVTKILWNKEECPDRNGNGVIDTSDGTNVLPWGADECIVYQVQPKPVYGNYTNATNHTLRGVAAGPDGRVWIGYSNHNGGVQSIEQCATCPGGHKLGPFYPALNIPQYNVDANGYFTRASNQTIVGGHSYGLVLDAQGILYYVSWSWDRFLAFDTNTGKWLAAYYTPNHRWQYGIALDAEGRIWMGSYPNGSGVKMFNPKVRKTGAVGEGRVYYYPSNQGMVTGLAVEPGTGDVWASFYQKGLTGRLRLTDPNDVTKHSWTLIPTTKTGGTTTGNLSGVGNDLRGVGFDIDGYAWTMGTGSDRIFKLDPATNHRHVDLPLGKSVGVGQHYTYSDFTGSTALSFTAPAGKWSQTYNVGGKQVVSITVSGHVPAGTNIGVRYRGVDANGAATTPWSPAAAGGTEYYHQFAAGQQTLKITIPQSNDNPFVVDKIQLDVRLSTSDKGVRPYLYDVSMEVNPEQPLWNDVQNVAADLSASFGVPGNCTEDDGTGCDTVRVGLAYFSDGITEITAPGEDTGGAISTGVAGAATGGFTGIDQVAAQLLASAQLQDASRSNFALVITDGKFNTIDQVSKAVRDLCMARERQGAPVTTYVMGPGATSDMTMNSLLAAAGGSGMCCEGGGRSSCGQSGVKVFDPCDWLNNPGKLAGTLLASGEAPYTRVSMRSGSTGLSCFGATPTTEVTAFKTLLADVSREEGCTLALHIPDDPLMYVSPVYPQIGALPDPRATRIRINHKDWNLVDVPFCPPGEVDCGFSDNLAPLGIGEPILTNFADEGWYFVDETVRDKVRLTDRLCTEISAGRVKNTTSQIACQCGVVGDACQVTNPDGSPKLGRCGVGAYACGEGQVKVCNQVHFPMPEICNGLDDDCDGSIDNLTTTAQNVPELPERYAHLQCLNRDACVCPAGASQQHLGQGITPALELEDYLQANLETESGCYCSGGLEADVQPAQTSPAAAPALVQDLPSGGKQSASCAVSSAPGRSPAGAGGVSAALALAGALVWLRRRREP